MCVDPNPIASQALGVLHDPILDLNFLVKVSVSPKGVSHAIAKLHLSQERFSVTVFGEGSGPWTSPSGEVHTPTASKPIAVMWPSTKEIRSMLHATWTLTTSLSKF